MKTLLPTKRPILVNILKKLLTQIVQNFLQFGMSNFETVQFINQAIFNIDNNSVQGALKSNKNHTLTEYKKIPVKPLKKNSNFAYIFLSSICLDSSSQKILLKYIENCYYQKSILTQEFFLEFAQIASFQNNNCQKIQSKSINLTKLEKKIPQQNKNNNNIALDIKSQELFDSKRLIFSEKSCFYDQQQNEFEAINQKFDLEQQVWKMQMQIFHLKELQKNYQKKLDEHKNLREKKQFIGSFQQSLPPFAGPYYK